jgi:hypothetical protein
VHILYPNLAYATNSSFHGRHSDTHFLSLAKGLNFNTKTLYHKIKRSIEANFCWLWSYTLPAYQNRTQGSHNGSSKIQSEISIFYYNCSCIGTVDNYQQCHGFRTHFHFCVYMPSGRQRGFEYKDYHIKLNMQPKWNNYYS